MNKRAILVAAFALAMNGAPAVAQSVAPPVNLLIDYPGFEKLVGEVGPLREQRRLGWERFAAEARGKGAILLDARSSADFERGHIAGAVNLPFSEFTDARLAQVIGPDRNRPIYIYCNNNFSDNVAPIVTKRVQLALNIPTFINLVGYGYGNVWELAEVVSIRDPRIGWVSGIRQPG
jgi:phage shock protein E